MGVAAYLNQITSFFIGALNSSVFAPEAVIPSLGVALMMYLLVTRQLEMIHEDPAAEEFGTAGEANEWLGGPTSEWLGV